MNRPAASLLAFFGAALLCAAAPDPAAAYRDADAACARLERKVGEIEGFRAGLTGQDDASARGKADAALAKARQALALAYERRTRAAAALEAARPGTGEAREKSLRVALGRGTACALEAFSWALTPLGPEALAFGDAFARKSSEALARPEGVMALHESLLSDGKAEQAVADLKVVSDAASGNTTLSFMYQASPPGGLAAEGQTVLVFSPDGARRAVSASRNVSACLERP
jgi:hypothetical protein